MAKNNKSQKSLLSESAIRRMMKLAEIPALAENFFNEKQGYDDREDERESEEHGAEGEKEQSFKDRRDDAGFEVRKEEDELEATEDELGAEDAVADEEGAELDAEAGAAEGEAEITPEAAQAIIDLGAQLEAAGATEEGAEEVEAGAEEMEVGAEEEVEAVEDEELEEDIFEAALRGLGVEVVDDSAARLNEVKRKVYKRVISRLLKESKTQKTSTPKKQKIRRRRG